MFRHLTPLLRVLEQWVHALRAAWDTPVLVAVHNSSSVRPATRVQQVRLCQSHVHVDLDLHRLRPCQESARAWPLRVLPTTTTARVDHLNLSHSIARPGTNQKSLAPSRILTAMLVVLGISAPAVRQKLLRARALLVTLRHPPHQFLVTRQLRLAFHVIRHTTAPVAMHNLSNFLVQWVKRPRHREVKYVVIVVLDTLAQAVLHLQSRANALPDTRLPRDLPLHVTQRVHRRVSNAMLEHTVLVECRNPPHFCVRPGRSACSEPPSATV